MLAAKQVPADKVNFFISYTGCDVEFAEWVAWELKRADLPEKLKQHLTRCRKELYSAPVSTIHAFCARQLREAGRLGGSLERLDALWTEVAQADAAAAEDVFRARESASMLATAR